MIIETIITRCTFLRGARVAPKVQVSTQKNCEPEFLILLALKSPSCTLAIFIDMNTFILTESRNSNNS